MVKCGICGQEVTLGAATFVWVVLTGYVSRHPAIIHDFNVNACFEQYEWRHRGEGVLMSRTLALKGYAAEALELYEWHEDEAQALAVIAGKLPA